MRSDCIDAILDSRLGGQEIARGKRKRLGDKHYTNSVGASRDELVLPRASLAV